MCIKPGYVLNHVGTRPKTARAVFGAQDVATICVYRRKGTTTATIQVDAASKNDPRANHRLGGVVMYDDWHLYSEYNMDIDRNWFDSLSLSTA